MAEPWLATLAEVRRQAARVATLSGVQPPETDGTWYDVAAGSVETSDLETLDESGAWRGLQWLNAFEIMFFERPKELMGCEQSDDLLFFVVNEAYQGGADKLLVRRKGAGIPEDLGRGSAMAERIDWYRTTLLNLVIQASFLLTVATCRRTDIQLVTHRDAKPPPDASRVITPVYASPMEVNVNLEGERSKEEKPEIGYPNINFGVEDFDNAFKSLILTEPGWCYVVSLYATGGMALAAAPSMQAAPAPCPAVSEGIDRSYKRRLSGATSLEERLASLDLQPPRHEQSLLEATNGRPVATVPEPQHAAVAEQPHAARGALEQSAQQQQQQQAAAAAPDAPAPLHDDPLRRPAASATPFAAASEPLASAAHDGARAELGGQPRVQTQQGEPARQAGPMAAAMGAASGDVRPLELFTGFVSHEQLDACIGSTSERRAARRQETTHWIKMRGPGDQGYADVATTSLRPLDEGHLKAAAAPDAAPRSRPSAGPFSRALDAVARSAADAAKGLVREVLGGRGEEEHLRLRCALMRLCLPIDVLATKLLQLPLLDQAPPPDQALASP